MISRGMRVSGSTLAIWMMWIISIKDTAGVDRSLIQLASRGGPKDVGSVAGTRR